MDTDFLSPLNLTVKPFTIGADGDEVTPNALQIINPNKTPMLIDEFKFSAGVGTGALGARGIELASVQTKISYGATPLTNDFIPLVSFAPYYFGYPSATSGGPRWGDCTLTWHLKNPLYVPPDVQVSVTFKRKNPFIYDPEDGPSVTLPWGFSINGRSMPSGMQVPEKIYVPWACATSIYGRTTADLVLPYQSPDSDLGNPHNQPLNIDYFTGFNMGIDPPLPSKTPITVQLTLSNGKVLLRDPTPLNLLFPPDRPVLRTRALLQPKEFISALIDVPIPTEEDPQLAAFTTIGMTGWREMQTPKGAMP